MEKQQPASKRFIFIGICIVAVGITLTTTLQNAAGFGILGMGAIMLIVGFRKKKQEDKQAN